MIPRPHSFQTSELSFELTGRLLVVLAPSSRSTEAQTMVRLFVSELCELGIDAELWEGASERRGVSSEIIFSSPLGSPRGESHRILISSQEVRIEAASPAGLFYASRTLLLQAGAEGKIALGVLEDKPRYTWRGAHLDVARHFFPVADIKRFIDLLALHKLNVFHWHLTEDQGWRIQIDAFPRLSEVSAYRKSEEGMYGGFYSKAEVREVVAYAKERHVSVVPEIEMPGHAVAALAAYPELSCAGGPFAVERRWGVFDDVFCVGQDRTLEFLKSVLDEVIELFESDFFHVGGDECPKVRWKNCECCQARILAEGLKDESELQSWFIRGMSQYLGERGKRLVGWDEILEGGLAPGATVMSWRGTEGGIRAARMGHDVVMSPTSHCYFDYKQRPGETEPGAWFAPALELETVYQYDPTPQGLSPEDASHVLGVQANVWTERMPHFKQVEYMAFPRLCALAEVAWSSAERDFADFEERLCLHLKFLDRWKVAYRGSLNAEPVPPTREERESYTRAVRDRAEQKKAVAY